VNSKVVTLILYILLQFILFLLCNFCPQAMLEIILYLSEGTSSRTVNNVYSLTWKQKLSYKLWEIILTNIVACLRKVSAVRRDDNKTEGEKLNAFENIYWLLKLVDSAIVHDKPFLSIATILFEASLDSRQLSGQCSIADLYILCTEEEVKSLPIFVLLENSILNIINRLGLA
jgi:hypothetical protein